MTGQLGTDTHARSTGVVDVVVVVVVVPPEIILQPARGQGKEVVMRLVVATAVIVIHSLLGVVVIDPEVTRNFGVEWYVCLHSLSVFRSLDVEGLAIPTVETAVVLRLSHHVEDEIFLQ